MILIHIGIWTAFGSTDIVANSTYSDSTMKTDIPGTKGKKKFVQRGKKNYFFSPKKKLTNVFGTVEKVFLSFFFASQGLFFFS